MKLLFSNLQEMRSIKQRTFKWVIEKLDQYKCIKYLKFSLKSKNRLSANAILWYTIHTKVSLFMWEPNNYLLL